LISKFYFDQGYIFSYSSLADFIFIFILSERFYFLDENLNDSILELVIIYKSPLLIVELRLFIIIFSSIEKRFINSSDKIFLYFINPPLIRNEVGDNVSSQSKIKSKLFFLNFEIDPQIFL